MVRPLTYIILGFMFFLGMIRACSSNNEMANVYKVARDVGWYPLDLQGKEQNMVGFTNDLFAAISTSEQVRIELFDVSSKSLFFGLERDDWDGVLSSAVPDVFNKQRYEFSEPFYVSGFVLVVPTNSAIQTIADIQGKIVGISKEGVQLGSNFVQSNAYFTPYMRISNAVEELVSNRIDAVIMDYTAARLYVHGVFAGKLKIITKPQIEEALRLVAKKTPQGAELVKIFNSGLSKLSNDGTLEKLLIKWSVISP